MRRRPRQRFPVKRILLTALALLLLFGGYWTYRLIWGRPMSIAMFYERAFIEVALQSPELLSQVGIVDNTILDFHSDKLDDASPAMVDKQAAWARENLAVLQAYDLADQTPDQKLSTAILGWFLDTAARGERFRYHNYPINQLFGDQSELPSFMVSIHQVKDSHSARNYIRRLRAFGTHFDQQLQTIKLEESKGIVPPRFVITEVLAQMRGFVGVPAEENILYSSFKTKLDKAGSFSDADKTARLAEVKAAITEVVYPAYGRLIAFFADLEPRATTDDGVWKLPDGDAFYAWKLREQTTSDMTPQEVHELGLSEVARLQTELTNVLDSAGAAPGTVGQRLAALTIDPRFLYPDSDDGRAAILADYRKIIEDIDSHLQPTFSLLPKGKVRVERVPEFKEKTAPGAYYEGPALDGSRPGTFYANLGDIKITQKWGMKTLAYHEAVPGHHLQLSIAAELQGQPTFRSIIPFTAFMEGWALYAERLAWELGYEQDPYDNIGRLQAELFRAARLVVDTGIHYKHWTREQAIAYLADTTGMAQSDVVAEIERYIVMPGQACAYKVGMMKILQLREMAKHELGAKFDIADFHRVVLGAGAMPLDVLQGQVERYIAEKKG